MSVKRRSSWGSNEDAGRGRRRIRYWADLHDGKGYRRVSETIEGSRRDGDEALAMRRVQHSADAPVPTLAQAYEAWWLPEARGRVERGEMAKVTLANYESRWRRHVRPAFGDRPLTDVRPLEVQDWLLGMTAPMASISLSLMDQVYRKAVMYGVCEANPAALGYRMPVAQGEHSKDVYTLAEMTAALSAVRGTCAYVPAVLCGVGSARVGESLGAITAEDVRSAESHGMGLAVVDVRRQVDRYGHVMDRLKTAQSARPLVIPEPWSADVLAVGTRWLCDQGDGTPVSQLTVGRVWKEALEAAGVKPIPFRNLRNSWRTISRWELGIPEDMCERMMGHAGRNVGERHYDRPDADRFVDAVAAAYVHYRAKL